MQSSNELALMGIDGGNPLGFLAAVGAMALATTFSPLSRMSWRQVSGAWRPVVSAYDGTPESFLDDVHRTLHSATTRHLEIDRKLPFGVEKFEAALRSEQGASTRDDRRTVDFLAAFGSEAKHDKGVFEDSLFRMVRSGDAAGQGLPYYALEIRKAIGLAELRRTLWFPWDYRDSGFSLRIDPLEDQRYALRWKNPSKSGLADGPGTMLGANALAIEALPLFPTVVSAGHRVTTGFHRNRLRQTSFSWPIWECPLSIYCMRSLLALAKLRDDAPPREELARMGIVEIYRCQRIAQNQYYSNFAPARPA